MPANGMGQDTLRCQNIAGTARSYGFIDHDCGAVRAAHRAL